MGTDIHLMVEVREHGGPWQAIEPPALRRQERYEGDDPTRAFVWDFWRDYDSFAILGNVRNGYAFAGCDTGDGFVPLTDQRGLPDDASATAIEARENGDLGDHSFSHCTLAELLAYPHWYAQTTKRGVVNAWHYANWRDRTRAPYHYSGGVDGKDIVHLTNEQMDAHVKAHPPERPKTDWAFGTHFTQVSWPESYRDAALNLALLLADLVLLNRSPQDVRLVFGFDS